MLVQVAIRLLQQSMEYIKDPYSPQSSSENSKHIVQFATLVYLIGSITCLILVSYYIVEQQPLNVFISFIMLLACLFSMWQIRLNPNNFDYAFGLLSISALIAIFIGVAINFGLGDSGLYMLYPLILIAGISFRNRPHIITVMGGLSLCWLWGLFYAEQQEFYAGKADGFSLLGKTFFLSWTILLMVLTLRIVLENLLKANRRIEQKTQDVLMEKANAEFANRAKSTFLANMSHELRTPLNAIIGYSEMIGEDAEELAGAEIIHSDAKKIQVSATSLLRIINTILDTAKIETGETKLNLQQVDIKSMIEEVNIMLRPQVESKGNSLMIALDSVPETILVDRQKILQVLVNLLSNANKFTFKGNIQLKASQSKHQVIFSVQDSGIGIPSEAIDRIFSPFQQVNNAYNRKFDGAGLGLSICQQLVELMNGSIEVESTLGQGSTFSIILPLA